MLKIGLSFIIVTFFYTLHAYGQCGPSFTPLDLGNDTTICQGQGINIGTQNTYDTYLWNTGSMSPTLSVTNSGTYTLNVSTLGQNLVTNGDFSQGNTGFTSNYIYGTGGSWGLLSNEGQYAIAANANQTHNNFANCFNHTTGNAGGAMMVVNGSSVPNAVIWSQTITVSPNTNYQFSTWAASVVSSNPGILRFMINGVQVGTQLNLSPTLCNWQQFFVNWNSGTNTSIQIAIINQNTSNDGNDFAIDDISFRPVCTSSDNIVVSVEAAPLANLGPNVNLCQGETATLGENLNAASYLWNTGETSQTIEVSQSGQYQVNVVSPNGCSAIGQINVLFEGNPNAGDDLNLTFCNTENIVDLSEFLSNEITTNGTWSSNNPTISGLLGNNGLLQVNTLDGAYAIEYLVAGTHCPNDTATITITVNRQPIAGEDGHIHICNNALFDLSLEAELNIIEASLTGFWLPNSEIGAGFNDELGAINAGESLPGNYTISYVMLGAGTCVNDTALVQVWISQMPVNQFVSDTTNGCEALTVSFINEPIAAENTTYSYQLSDGHTYNNVFAFTHVFQNAGCYDVVVSAVTDGICEVTELYENMICVDPLPVASFTYSPDPVFADNTNVTFNNTSELNYQNFWTFGDGSSSDAANPTHAYEAGIAQTYLVTLIVASEAGCTDTTFREIEIREQLLFYVPNTFTPDGNSFNPEFIPVMTTGFDPYNYHLTIFNRWGELVFETRHPNRGWDGKYGGQMAGEGTYVWVLKFGHEYNDKVYFFQGHVNLLR
jgi:gliding motility-associated-like protein